MIYFSRHTDFHRGKVDSVPKKVYTYGKHAYVQEDTNE